MKLKEKNNVPRIRFDYFKEEWDEKRFKDFTKLSQGLQIAISSRFLEGGENRYFYITNEFLNPNSTKKYYIESPSENVICTVDDILMTRTGNTGKVITNISGAFHNNFFKVDYDNLETSKMFLYYLLTSNNIHKEIIIRAGNSTIPDLNHSDFYSIKTSVPSLPEQFAIGSLFRTLDDLLSSYKDNLTNYQSLKATMLSKMFPKAGQTVPEIRLDGFEGEWENGTIGEYGSFYYGKSAPKWSVTDDATTPCVRYGELYTKFSTKIDEIYSYTSIPKENLKLSSGNEVLVPRVGEDPLDFANCSWLSLKGVAIGEMISVYNTPNNPLFIAYYFNAKMKKEFAKRVEGGSVANLYYTYLENISISIPSFSEQSAIGSYFFNLDNLINSHQEKISQLETLKKKLLQDMFI